MRMSPKARKSRLSGRVRFILTWLPCGEENVNRMRRFAAKAPFRPQKRSFLARKSAVRFSAQKKPPRAQAALAPCALPQGGPHGA